MDAATAFIIAYPGFMLGYPFLQLWTLIRCRKWWRTASVICMVFALPLYIWAWVDRNNPNQGASLMMLLFAFLGSFPMLFLMITAVGFEFTARRNRLPASETVDGDLLASQDGS